MATSYEAVIGLEIHMELNTKSKIFCSCPTTFGAASNTQCCPVCCGLPGTLPVLNREVVKKAARFGMAAHCEIAPLSKQDRKNYFYPDLPKAYQISQYDMPLCKGGYVDIVADGEKKRIRLNRIHIEEDAGKLIHVEGKGTLIDFNRCGVPLIEIVTEPDIRSSAEAVALLQKLRAMALYVGASEAAMEKGQMRCDVNLSIHKPDEPYGTRTEMKNLNSFTSVVHAIDVEYRRQVAQVESGTQVVQETRRFDAQSGKTYSMRSKENDSDYRYFPDPDLPPIHISAAQLTILHDSIPRLPDERAEQYVSNYALTAQEADRVVARRDMADAFERALPMLPDGIKPRTAAVLLADTYADAQSGGLSYDALDGAKLCRICRLLDMGKISHATAREVTVECMKDEIDVDSYIAAHAMSQISDTAAIESTVHAVLSENADLVERVRAGKLSAINALVGLCMKRMSGRGNARLIRDAVERELKM